MAHLDTSDAQAAFVRRRTGIAPTLTGLAWWQRLLRDKWTWATLTLVVALVASIWILLADVMRTREYTDGSISPGLNSDALWLAAGRALPTMVFWIVCFILVDRYRPQRLTVWLLALGWGGCLAVTAAYYLNSWIGSQMAVVDETSGVSAIRVAVFVAPFVEEAMKACVIFLIVALDRNRFTSWVSGAVVGGLAGAGFA
ncbi:MAG: PrsW family intramembrane metalloprotease, partial [Propionibacteriaceae bacterium]|nr:PrsW family intramembrane metalloprotease [Propionibacteriaceae bacterium]